MARKKSMLLKNPQHELFCREFVRSETLGNGTAAYAKAYGKDIADPKQYMVCAAGSSALLKNLKVSARISELLDIVMSDEVADAELAYVIAQKAELSPKVAAIGLLSKLRGRIVDKVEHSFDESKQLPPSATEAEVAAKIKAALGK